MKPASHDVEFDAEALRIIKRLGHDVNRSESRSTITVNAGGIGVWIATTCCAVMLACGLLGALWVSREFARYDNHVSMLQSRDNAHQAYLNAIFRAAPELKQAADKEK